MAEVLDDGFVMAEFFNKTIPFFGWLVGPI